MSISSKSHADTNRKDQALDTEPDRASQIRDVQHSVIDSLATAVDALRDARRQSRSDPRGGEWSAFADDLLGFLEPRLALAVVSAVRSRTTVLPLEGEPSWEPCSISTTNWAVIVSPGGSSDSFGDATVVLARDVNALNLTD
jgi:hypothetical protein